MLRLPAFTPLTGVALAPPDTPTYPPGAPPSADGEGAPLPQRKPPADLVLLRFRELREAGIVGSRSALSRLQKNDASFPAPILLNGGSVWYAHEVRSWLASQPRVTRRKNNIGKYRDRLSPAELRERQVASARARHDRNKEGAGVTAAE